MKDKNTALISRDALVSNYRTLEQIAGPGMRVICVVKADAYGHGAAAVSEILGEAGCSFFAVSSEEEAAELRALENRFGRHPDILILGPIDPDNVPVLLENDIIAAAVSDEHVRALSAAAASYNEENGTDMPLRIHVKLDTGMNRVGFAADAESLDRTVSEIEAASLDRNLRLEGIFTHFACADDDLCGRTSPLPDSMTARQCARWNAALALLGERGVNCGLRHAANSAAALSLRDAAGDAVRAGLALYGMMPDETIDPRFRPVMTFCSAVRHIHHVKAGESISYGAAYTAPRDMTVATIAAGYGDGFQRRFGGCTVEIRGHAVQQIGRICMDQCMADITDFPDIAVGDRVVLFGADDGSMLTSLAKRAGTISYEILCGISGRVHRIVTGGNG